MRKLALFLCAAAITICFVSCSKNESRSVFDGYTIGMSRDTVISMRGEPSSSFDALKNEPYDFAETYDEISYFGLKGFLRFFYRDKDNPVLTGICWGTSGLNNIKTLGDVKTETDRIIKLYDKLCGEHRSYVSDENDGQTTFYEWKDGLLNTITLELHQFAEMGHIVLDYSRK